MQEVPSVGVDGSPLPSVFVKFFFFAAGLEVLQEAINTHLKSAKIKNEVSK
jgi:hypothetical protein